MADQKSGLEEVKKRRYKGDPFQIRWEPDVKAAFQMVIKQYDEDLSMGKAILKLVRWAIKENWIPGYSKLGNKPLDDTMQGVIDSTTNNNRRNK